MILSIFASTAKNQLLRDSSPDGFTDLFDADGFQKVTGKTRVFGSLRILRRAMPADRDPFKSIGLLKFPQQFAAVSIAKSDVAQKQIETAVLSGLASRGRAVGRGDFVAVTGQQLRHHLERIKMIFHHQNS